MSLRRPTFLSRLAWVLLAPFLLTTLVAPGVMPHRDALGAVEMVLCSDGAPLVVQSYAETGAPSEDGRSGATHGCAWAAAHFALAITDNSADLVPAEWRPERGAPFVRIVSGLSGLPDLPPGRGPPVAV
jgi:hypothetical protein